MHVSIRIEGHLDPGWLTGRPLALPWKGRAYDQAERTGWQLQ
jgi:hypothetical protein